MPFGCPGKRGGEDEPGEGRIGGNRQAAVLATGELAQHGVEGPGDRCPDQRQVSDPDRRARCAAALGPDHGDYAQRSKAQGDHVRPGQPLSQKPYCEEENKGWRGTGDQPAVVCTGKLRSPELEPKRERESYESQGEQEGPVTPFHPPIARPPERNRQDHAGNGEAHDQEGERGDVIQDVFGHHVHAAPD